MNVLRLSSTNIMYFYKFASRMCWNLFSVTDLYVQLWSESQLGAWTKTTVMTSDQHKADQVQ